jgi:predicted nucleic acid-binding protein
VIVVSDTSIFLNLGCLGQDALLPPLYPELIAPPAVRDEFVFATRHYARFPAIRCRCFGTQQLLMNRRAMPGSRHDEAGTFRDCFC